MKLAVEEFIKLRNIVYDRAGIYFETNKIYFVKKRIEKRMEALNLQQVEEYVAKLKFKDKFGQEMQQLLNLMTTNETYFFREELQLKVFEQHCLPDVLNRKGDTPLKQLKIWSAGCSSGEEAYTIAIILREKFPDIVANAKLSIYATDIDTEILEKAQQGIYNQRSVRFVPPHLLSRYFTKMGENYAVTPSLKEMVEFRHMNLMNGLKMRIMRSMDFIFCRNVLIYFDDTSRKSVVANFYDSLNPGGYIYLGHSESITRINTAFNIKRAGGMIVHQKPYLQEV